MGLAQCSRAGQLSAVWIPDRADEAIRDLARAREDAVNSRRQVRQQLALRGVAAITAIGLVAEIGDLNRFETGNGHARRLLIEAAWNDRFKPRVGKEINARQEGLSEAVRTMAWKGQLRLTERYAGLQRRGVQANKGCVAVARELAGFVWAVGMQAQREKTAA